MTNKHRDTFSTALQVDLPLKWELLAPAALSARTARPTGRSRLSSLSRRQPESPGNGVKYGEMNGAKRKQQRPRLTCR